MSTKVVSKSKNKVQAEPEGKAGVAEIIAIAEPEKRSSGRGRDWTFDDIPLGGAKKFPYSSPSYEEALAFGKTYTTRCSSSLTSFKKNNPELLEDGYFKVENHKPEEGRKNGWILVYYIPYEQVSRRKK